jgi:hypothetical protein
MRTSIEYPILAISFEYSMASAAILPLSRKVIEMLSSCGTRLSALDVVVDGALKIHTESVSSFIGSGEFWPGACELSRMNISPSSTPQPPSASKEKPLAHFEHRVLSRHCRQLEEHRSHVKCP